MYKTICLNSPKKKRDPHARFKNIMDTAPQPLTMKDFTRIQNLSSRGDELETCCPSFNHGFSTAPPDNYHEANSRYINIRQSPNRGVTSSRRRHRSARPMRSSSHGSVAHAHNQRSGGKSSSWSNIEEKCGFPPKPLPSNTRMSFEPRARQHDSPARICPPQSTLIGAKKSRIPFRGTPVKCPATGRMCPSVVVNYQVMEDLNTNLQEDINRVYKTEIIRLDECEKSGRNVTKQRQDIMDHWVSDLQGHCTSLTTRLERTIKDRNAYQCHLEQRCAEVGMVKCTLETTQCDLTRYQEMTDDMACEMKSLKECLEANSCQLAEAQGKIRLMKEDMIEKDKQVKNVKEIAKERNKARDALEIAQEKLACAYQELTELCGCKHEMEKIIKALRRELEGLTEIVTQIQARGQL